MTVNDETATTREAAWNEHISKFPDSNYAAIKSQFFWGYDAHAALAVPAGKGEIPTEADLADFFEGVLMRVSDTQGISIQLAKALSASGIFAPVDPVAVQGESDEAQLVRALEMIRDGDGRAMDRETARDALVAYSTFETDLNGWANWFENGSATVGSKQWYMADEVAALLRGPKLFGTAQGEGDDE